MQSLNKRLKEALDPIGLPVRDSVYSGKENRYIVFNYDAVKDDFADDKAEHLIYLIQVHLFAPAGENTLQIREKIKKNLYAAGFDYPDETDASDKDGQHRVFELEEAGGIDYGEA